MMEHIQAGWTKTPRTGSSPPSIAAVLNTSRGITTSVWVSMIEFALVPTGILIGKVEIQPAYEMAMSLFI